MYLIKLIGIVIQYTDSNTYTYIYTINITNTISITNNVIISIPTVYKSYYYYCY